MVGFSSASLLPAREWEAVTQGGDREIDHPMWRKNPGKRKKFCLWSSLQFKGNKGEGFAGGEAAD